MEDNNLHPESEPNEPDNEHEVDEEGNFLTANLYEKFRTKPGRKAVKKLRKYESVVFPWLVFLFLHRSCGARKQKQTVCKLTIYTGDVALYQQNIFAVQTLEKKSL